MNVSMTLGKNQDKTSGSFSPLQTWRDRGQLRQFAPVAQLKIPHENRLEYIHDLLISPLHDFPLLALQISQFSRSEYARPETPSALQQ